MSKFAPCGRTTGHGESCSEGWLCGHCEEIAELKHKVQVYARNYNQLSESTTEEIASLKAVINELRNRKGKSIAVKYGDNLEGKDVSR
jgi:hypothetical protein